MAINVSRCICRKNISCGATLINPDHPGTLGRRRLATNDQTTIKFTLILSKAKDRYDMPDKTVDLLIQFLELESGHPSPVPGPKNSRVNNRKEV